MEIDTDPSDLWHILPDPALLYVFSYLNAKELLNVRNTCRNWLRVATDELLWKRLFHNDFKIDKSIPIAPGKCSWFDEYRRLKFHTPIQQSEVLSEHKHQVLHVSFSHNGEMFASSSKDGYIKVWRATYPAQVRYSADMKSFSWNYTQFSQFNESDTLLLVSGVHFGAHTASGEIAIFNLQGNFRLQCRVLNKPYDIFGTWYAEDYLLSGRLHFLGHLLSCSSLWINKAWQEPESVHKPTIKRLFRFYNRKGGSVRAITVANCLITDQEMNTPEYGPSTSSQPVVHGNPISRDALSNGGWPLFRGRTLALRNRSFNQDTKIHFGAETKEACTMNSPIRYTQEYRRAESAEMQCKPSVKEENASSASTSPDTNSDCEDPLLPWDEEWRGLSEEENSHSVVYEHSMKEIFHKSYPNTPSPSKSSPNEEEDSDETVDSIEEDTSFDRILVPRDKFLIFATGSLTYTPHQIGFKRIKPFKFAERMAETPPPTPSEQMEERETEETVPLSPNLQDVQKVLEIFDPIDHIIDLHGHIIGMGLSPDHRYLYVNSRPWPQGYVIENPLTPPPIAQEIDIHVIDMMTLKEVGTMLRSHKAYTPNDECFFIFLDVSDQYVASGAEDKHGYLWDRHYGNCLSKYPHNDVVNSVAFNPKDPEMMVTASDDFTLKVWRSKNRVRELRIGMEEEMDSES